MQAREIQASMDNKLYLCDEELGSSRLCVLCGKPCLGVGAALGGKDARWRLHPWQGSAELVLLEWEHHVRGQGHPAPASDADRQLHTNHHHRHIFGRMKEICILLIGLTGFAKNLFMGLLAPASASQPANKRQMSAKTFAKLACQLLISWRRNTGCIQSAGPVSPEFDKSSSPADLAQGRQGRHRG